MTENEDNGNYISKILADFQSSISISRMVFRSFTEKMSMENLHCRHLSGRMLFGMERGRGKAAAKDDFSKYQPWEIRIIMPE